MTAKSGPPRVIHVVASLDKASVEVWLLRMLNYAVEIGVPVDWTFYCTEGRGGIDGRARALGAKVVYSPVAIGTKLNFVRALRSHLRQERYDVLHAHHDLVSAVYLTAAALLPLRRRIVHVHNADESVPTSNVTKQVILQPTLRRICLTLADQIVANSNRSLDISWPGESAGLNETSCTISAWIRRR